MSPNDDGGTLQQAIEQLRDRAVVVLTGAGISTDSGIPAYRGPGSRPSNPITVQEYMGSEQARRRYWARNHLGWRRVKWAVPNEGHQALAELERGGAVRAVITQNVDRLHEDSGSENVVDLHGRVDQIICTECGDLLRRRTLEEILTSLNPGFVERAEALGVVEAPDADAQIDDSLAREFVVAPCPRCGGVLKPDFVFFGENVPKPRLARALKLVDEAEVLLVAGTSLTVMSGLRFVRQAAKAGTPVVLVNQGPTRGDEFATVRLHSGTSETLRAVADALLPRRSAGRSHGAERVTVEGLAAEQGIR
ncbi:NAD-dependent protein deacetylase [Arthrobacter sp. NPDC090010]|uniref:NAD-dependent protein deacetylase n=1 Tax=Arthrobacter sp. NPDC090010 TaxID=3363942 RepID=UPI00380BEFDD